MHKKTIIQILLFFFIILILTIVFYVYFYDFEKNNQNISIKSDYTTNDNSDDLIENIEYTSIDIKNNC